MTSNINFCDDIFFYLKVMIIYKSVVGILSIFLFWFRISTLSAYKIITDHTNILKIWHNNYQKIFYRFLKNQVCSFHISDFMNLFRDALFSEIFTKKWRIDSLLQIKLLHPIVFTLYNEHIIQLRKLCTGYISQLKILEII